MTASFIRLRININVKSLFKYIEIKKDFSVQKSRRMSNSEQENETKKVIVTSKTILVPHAIRKEKYFPIFRPSSIYRMALIKSEINDRANGSRVPTYKLLT